MKKSIREHVHQKFGGHCAYCGEEITLKQMQVDHVEPIWRGNVMAESERRRLEGIDNLHPACRPCNHRKMTLTVEDFRAEIEAQIPRLIQYSSQFRTAERFGLVELTEKPVIFWFER